MNSQFRTETKKLLLSQTPVGTKVFACCSCITAAVLITSFVPFCIATVIEQRCHADGGIVDFTTQYEIKYRNLRQIKSNATVKHN